LLSRLARLLEQYLGFQVGIDVLLVSIDAIVTLVEPKSRTVTVRVSGAAAAATS
jgi:hypothetical protein